MTSHDQIDFDLPITPRAKRYFIAMIAGAVLIWLVVGVVPHWLPEQWLKRLGDPYAAAQALFNSLAIAGVIITILLQSQELRLQRQELSETRAELKKSATAQEQSQRALMMSVYLSAFNTLIGNENSAMKDHSAFAMYRHFSLSTSLHALLSRLQSDAAISDLPSKTEALVLHFNEQGRLLEFMIKEEVAVSYMRKYYVLVRQDIEKAIAVLSATEVSESILKAELASIFPIIDRATVLSELDATRKAGKDLVNCLRFLRVTKI